MGQLNRQGLDRGPEQSAGDARHAKPVAAPTAPVTPAAANPTFTPDGESAPPLTPAMDPKIDARLRASFEHCHQITRRRARNFYYGLKLLPEPKRSAMYAIYAFMRACDDLADGLPTSDHSRDGALRRIEQFREAMQHAIADPDNADATRLELPNGELWPAFRYVVRHYQIDPQHFHDMLAGQRQDLTRSRYDTFDELFEYCQKVASTVGLVCLSVWGHDGETQCKTLATYRGIAFQLTNILRDVREDAQRGRVYLPRNELERFGYTADELKQGVTNHAFKRLMMYQIERAQNYYDMSAPLEQHLAPDSRATSWAMTGIYRGLLDRITRDPGRVLTERIHLSSMQKMSIALRGTWRHWRAGKKQDR